MWTPQRGAQEIAWTADWCDELFYGGERGGGKSDLQIGFQEDGALTYAKHWRGIMFRKTFPELEELQARALEVFPGEGAIYKTQPSAEYPFSSCWYWPNGASVKMRYIEAEKDYGRYHGHQYTGISFDEVTEYASPSGLLKMLSTLRSAHGVPCRVRLTGNPGGIGHGWVKHRFISPSPPMVPFTEKDTGFTRMFVPSKTADNQILMRNDPGYRNRILAATGGNEALRQAWLDGNWDIVAGAFFAEFSRERHVLKPFTIPDHWSRYRAFDWGSSRPFCCLWLAVSDGSIRGIARGALVVYREWYGMGEEINVGLKMTTPEVARGIIKRDYKETIGQKGWGVADPAIFAQDGGESIAETMRKAGVLWRPADNKRVPGWEQIRLRLKGDDDSGPLLYVFDACIHLIRTLPQLQHDSHKIEDVDTDSEDHAPDTLRYGCMARPIIKDEAVKPKAVKPGSIEWTLARTRDEKKASPYRS